MPSSSQTHSNSQSKPLFRARTNRHDHSPSERPIIPDPLPQHANQKERQRRKEHEHKHGNFTWLPGVTLALIGTIMLLDVDKRIQRKDKKNREEEEQRRGGRGGGGGGR